MILALDSIGKRYGMLPSEAITRATTFDLFVLDASIGYENLVNARANGQEPSNQYTQDDLLSVVEKSRSRNET